MHLHGVVRKVQMTSSEPSYSVWVHLEESDPSVLADMRISWESVDSPSGPSEA